MKILPKKKNYLPVVRKLSRNGKVLTWKSKYSIYRYVQSITQVLELIS